MLSFTGKFPRVRMDRASNGMIPPTTGLLTPAMCLIPQGTGTLSLVTGKITPAAGDMSPTDGSWLLCRVQCVTIVLRSCFLLSAFPFRRFSCKDFEVITLRLRCWVVVIWVLLDRWGQSRHAHPVSVKMFPNQQLHYDFKKDENSLF